jgi:hypothetical protein
VKEYRGYSTTIYEEDLKDVHGDPQFKYIRIAREGTSYRIRPNPGKRPKRKPGESPLDPRSE